MPDATKESGKRDKRRGLIPEAQMRAVEAATLRSNERTGRETLGARDGDTRPDSQDDRQRRIAQVAYAIAERRGFAAGHELDDWLTAESMVDQRRS
jgi:DUF2934 family protein